MGPDGISTEPGRGGQAHLVVARGELDLAMAAPLKQAVAGAVDRPPNPVIIDLCQVTFIDSTGLAILLNAHRRLTRHRRGLVLVCGDGPVQSLLRLVQLQGTFVIRRTRSEAEQAARDGAGTVPGLASRLGRR